MKNNTWIVVADAARACIFETSSALAPLALVEEMAHPAGRQHARDIMAGKPGAQSNDVAAPHGLAPHTPVMDAELDKFARDIAKQLHTGHSGGKFQEVALAMPPKLLGMVRQHLDGGVKHAVLGEINRRLIDLPVDEIQREVDKLRK